MKKNNGISSNTMHKMYVNNRKKGKSHIESFKLVGLAKKVSKKYGINKGKSWKFKRKYAYKDFDGDGKVNKWDCEPLNQYKQDKPNEWLNLREMTNEEINSENKQFENEQDYIKRKLIQNANYREGQRNAISRYITELKKQKPKIKDDEIKKILENKKLYILSQDLGNFEKQKQEFSKPKNYYENILKRKQEQEQNKITNFLLSKKNNIKEKYKNYLNKQKFVDIKKLDNKLKNRIRIIPKNNYLNLSQIEKDNRKWANINEIKNYKNFKLSKKKKHDIEEESNYFMRPYND